MSQIAAAAGIGRATLYKYFPDIEARDAAAGQSLTLTVDVCISSLVHELCLTGEH